MPEGQKLGPRGRGLGGKGPGRSSGAEGRGATLAWLWLEGSRDLIDKTHGAFSVLELRIDKIDGA